MLCWSDFWDSRLHQDSLNRAIPASTPNTATRAVAPPAAVTCRREEGAVGRSLRTGPTHSAVRDPSEGELGGAGGRASGEGGLEGRLEVGVPEW